MAGLYGLLRGFSYEQRGLLLEWMRLEDFAERYPPLRELTVETTASVRPVVPHLIQHMQQQQVLEVRIDSSGQVHVRLTCLARELMGL